MTKTYSHRRGNFGVQNKAKPVEAMYAAGFSIISIIAYIVILIIDAFMAGETPKVVGGLAFVFFCMSVGAFCFNISQMKTKTEFRDRVICLCISSVSFLIWLSTFILGMVR